MSNELIAQLKTQLASLDGGVDDDTRAVAGTAYGKRISIKGGVFRKIAGGKEVGTIEDRHMEVIFVKMAHTPARTFYTETYKEGENVSPVCWSSDSKFPDSKVESPPASSCSTCPHSVQGTGAQGQGTACRLSWRTAVVLPKDPGGDVMQLVLPATSVFGKEDNGRWPFRAYIQMLAANNISAGRVITKMQFDTKSAVPKLLFSPVGAVPESDRLFIKAQSDSDAAASAIELTVFKKKEEGSTVPPAPPKEITEQTQLPLDEPSLRKSSKDSETASTTASTTDEVPDILKKWGKK
jgi:hypothetical protein